MKTINIGTRSARGFCVAALATALALTPPSLVNAEDIDLFVSAAATAATNPNILIVIDNSTNWASNSQHWEANRKQGESELRALRILLNELDGANPRVNMGLMMFTDGSGSDPSGAYVRFHMREMNTANKNALIELIGADTGCVDGPNSLNKTPNCILKNFQDPGEKVNVKVDYSAALFEAYKYFGGYSSPAFAQRDQQPTGAINDNKHHGRARYAGTVPNSRFDEFAYTDPNKTTYKDWFTNACGKNYVVFIGNGFPNDDTAGPLIQNVNGGSTPLLPAQFAMQNFTVLPGNTTTNLGISPPCQTRDACASAAASANGSLFDTYSCTAGVSSTVTLGIEAACKSSTLCATDAQLNFPGYSNYSCTGGVGNGDTFVYNVCSSAAQCAAAGPTVFPGYGSYSCDNSGTACGGGSRIGRVMTGSGTGCLVGQRKNQTMQAVDSSIVPACEAPNFRDQTMQGHKGFTTVTPLQTFSTPTGSTIRYTDEWAQFLYTTDVSAVPGQQNASVYTIDVFKDHQDVNQSALLFNMAKYGAGRYFQAKDENSIITALRQIMIEIQSVNSVFASASLPINATNRSQNENQVFIGMFRPDGSGNPRWYGNLKQYQIAKFGEEFKLADKTNPPQEAVSNETGFVQPCAASFWTVDSGSYWFFQNGSAGQCTSSPTSAFSDYPDGPQVEKGAVAEVLRRGNNPPGTTGAQLPPPAVNRALYTCATAAMCCPSCGTNPSTTLVSFDATNVSKTQLGNASMTDLERDNIINYTRGQDIFDTNNGPSGDEWVAYRTTDVRAAVHGDVAHSRPLPVNYGSTTGVVLFYGANDGTFRAVRGSDGKELWAFFAPEHHSKLKRLTDNAPRILYPKQVVSLKVEITGSFAVNDVVTGATSRAQAKVSSVVAPNELILTDISDAFLDDEDLLVNGTVQGFVLITHDARKKDYFFDGSAGLFQNATNTKLRVYPAMRRGGRMIYAFDISIAPNPADTSTLPKLLWRVGCSDPSLSNTSSCTAGFEQMGQTWSTPAVATIKGFLPELDLGARRERPVVVVGAGYDTCEDQDAAPNTACNRSTQRGSRVYVLDGDNGNKIAEFTTHGSVAGDITFVDRDFDGFADHAYVATTTGRIYRIDFVDPSNPGTIRTCPTWPTTCDWTISEVARTTSDRKFLFSPAALPASGKIYLSIASGDRERPLIVNYPFPRTGNPGVLNRAYMVVDDLNSPVTPLDLDGSSMADLSAGSDCSTKPVEDPTRPGGAKRGWFINLNASSTTDPNANVGEQAVTSSTIFAGLVFFSTNRPVPTPVGACANNLGEARGYALNLLTASGAADTLNICGGTRSGIFKGGGLPPSPVTGTVPVGPGGQPVTVMIGGVQRGGGISAPIGAQRVTPSITQRRSRVYWYNDGDK